MRLDEISRLLLSLTQEGHALGQSYGQHKAKKPKSSPWDPRVIQKSFAKAFQAMVADPKTFMETSQCYVTSFLALLDQMREKILDPSKPLEPLVRPEKGDRRFKDHLWLDHPYFYYAKQSYLLWDRWLSSFLTQLNGLDHQTHSQVSFFTRQMIHALSPSNFPHLNPSVIRETFEQGGANLLQGMVNFLQDLRQGQGSLKISMVDKKAFRLGENLAATPGHVVFQNDLIQLIQYESTTPHVHATPVVLIPPCINKYYIYDLRPENSFVAWLRDQGHQVFVVSWVNPDETLSHKSFEDYAIEGVGKAMQVARDIAQSKQVHGVGFCIGGNILSAYASYVYADAPDVPIFKSLTFLATPFDFQTMGDLQVFINEGHINALEHHMRETGYFDGEILAKTFNMLRANDLIWSFVINNYMMGRDPMAFDILYWNGDSTRLPATMYLYYLKNFFLRNLLIQPGTLKIRERPMDLRNIQAPTYILNTQKDHIIPWVCGYKGAQIWGGETTFVLGDSGHVAGIFNHPNAEKYGFRTAPVDPSTSHETWVENAVETKGSWWSHWIQWIQEKDPRLTKAKACGSKEYPILDAAPGTYVQVQHGAT